MSGEIKPIISAEAVEQLDSFKVSFMELLDGVDKINKKQVKFNTSGAKNIKEVQAATKELTAIEREELKVKKALETQQAKLVIAQSEEGKELVRLRSEIAATNRETKASESAYGAYSLEVKNAKDEAKELAAELITLKESGEASNEEIQEAEQRYQAAAEKAAEMDQQIKEVDESVGDHQRSVGDYNKALEGAAGNITIMGVNLGQLSGQVKKGISEGKSLIGITKAQTAATGGGVKALKIFKLALAATGIGLLVIAIGLVVVAVQKFQPLMDKVSIVMAQVGQVVNVLVDRFAKLGKGLITIFLGNPAKGFQEMKDATEGLNEELAREIKLAGELKAQLIELGRSQVILKVAVQETQAKIKELRNVYNSTTASVKEKSAAIEEAIILQKQITKAQEEEQKQLIANSFGYTEYNDKVKRVVEEIQSLDNLYSTSEERARIFNKTLSNLGLDLSTEDETKEFIESIGQLSSISAEGEGALIRLGAQSLSLSNQLTAEAKKASDQENARIASIEAVNRTQIEALQFELAEKLKVLKIDGEIASLTAKEAEARLKIEDEFQTKIEEERQKEAQATLEKLAALKEQATAYGENIAQLEILNNSNSITAENQQKVNQELNFYKDRLEDVTAELAAIGVEFGEIFDIQMELTNALDGVVSKSQEVEDALRKSFESGEIGAEEFLKGLSDVNSSLQRDLIEETIKTTNKILENESLSAEERLNVEEELIKAKADLRKADLENVKAKAQEQIDIEKASAEERKELESGFQQAKQEAINLAFQTASNIAALVAENRQTELSDELSEYKESEAAKQAYDATLLEQGQLTQEEFNAKKLKSDQAIARKESEIKRKQFEANKRASITQAVISGAQSVLQALASAPPPANFVLAGISGAAAAIQIALISRQKTPKFRKGVKNFGGGLATVGDGPAGRNRELVKLPNGKSFIAEKEMTMFLPTGTDVLKNQDTEDYLKKESTIPYLKNIDRSLKKKKGINIVIQNNVQSNDTINYINGRV